jgi:lactoylglutathione lyase
MLGLWSIGTAPIGLNLHVAFEVAEINDLLDAPKRLKDQGIVPISFFGKESMEPSVIGWMPAAAIYFRDPDGHMMEYLTMLDDELARPDLGIVSWSDWIANNK